MTADQFVALWGDGSAVKELRAINLEREAPWEKRKIEGEKRGGQTEEGKGGYRDRSTDKGRLFLFQFQLLKNHSCITQFYELHFIIFSTRSHQNQFTFKIQPQYPREISMKTHITMKNMTARQRHSPRVGKCFIFPL